MAISKKQASKLLTSKFPSFREFGEKEIDEFYDNEIKLGDKFSIDINTFARFLIKKLRDENERESILVEDMFSVIEDFMVNGDSNVSHDTAVNCVESLINLSLNGSISLDLLKEKFGPECILFWKSCDEAFRPN
ncbi:MAG: hypothetical protein AB8G05_26375 [Oligoflexales bacterium]